MSRCIHKVNLLGVVLECVIVERITVHFLSSIRELRLDIISLRMRISVQSPSRLVVQGSTNG